MNRPFRASDEGKHVFTADGELVGTVSSVEASEAHVDLDGGVPSSTVRNAVAEDEDGNAIIEQRHVDVVEGERLTLTSLETDTSLDH
ncbi:hypothetical protein [Haloarchaeobius sp. TZWWS8]|uniref:hypothetical protein n=1 Tax=Haloarchaeobius sp. TZWWS8 TaxID=3446121 RepID=UPI003EBD3BA7